jgi:hypothetical protein
VRTLRQLGYENTYELGGLPEEWKAMGLKVPKR